MGESVGEGVGKYGDDDGSKEIGGSAITLFGLVALFELNHKPRNSTVPTINVERITRRNACRFRV